MPQIFAAVRYRRDVIARKVSGDEVLTAVETDLPVSLEQGSIGEWRHVAVGQGFIGAVRCNDCVYFNFAADARARIHAAVQRVDTFTKTIRHAAGVIKAHGVLVVYPFQRHT